MEIFLAPFAQALAGVAVTALTGLAVQAWRWFGTQIHGSKVQLVVDAVTRAAGEVMDQLATVEGGPEAMAAAKEAAIGYAVDAIARVRLPDTVKSLGVNEATLAGMVRGELNKLIAQAGAVPAGLLREPVARSGA